MEKFARNIKSLPNYSFYLVCLILLIINIFISGSIELSFDEAYYWMYSKFLSFGYFDHPPMVALMIKISSGLFGNNEIAVRLIPNLFFIGTCLLLWNMTQKKNFWIFWASVLSMPLLSLGGMFALPDAPLMFFSCLFFYFVKRYLSEDNLRNVSILGLVIAAMFYSKYHGLLIVLLTVCGYPAFLKRKSFWLIVALTVLFFMPHMWWQYKNEFISFKFHLTGRTEKHFDIKNILDYIGGQVALMGIFNFVIFCYLFFKNKFKDPFERILLFNSFGFFVFLFFMSFRNQIEANWTVSCSLALIILFTDRIEGKLKKWFLAVASLPILLGLGIKFTLPALKTIFPITSTMESRVHELIHWDKRFAQINKVCAGKRVVGDNYQISSKYNFYNDALIPALHFGSRGSQYDIWNLDKNIPADEAICYLTSKNLPDAVRIETNYKDPVFILPNTSLSKLAERYGTTYEEIVRD